jgi:hypothetical protein
LTKGLPQIKKGVLSKRLINIDLWRIHDTDLPRPCSIE